MLKKDGSFEEKHIDISNLKSAINVIAFYFLEETNRRKQLKEKIVNYLALTIKRRYYWI